MMKFSVQSADLRAAIAKLKPAYQRRGKIPVLKNTLVEATADGLRLSQTNLDMKIRCDVKADCDHPGRITVPWPMLAGFAKSAIGIATFSVSVGKTGDVLTCDADGMSLRVNLVCPAEDWPMWGDYPATASADMRVADMHRMMRLTRHCISTEETRYYLNGVYIHGEEGKMRAVSTDAMRMAVIDSAVDWAGPAVIVPAGVVKAILAIWPKATDDAMSLDIADVSGGRGVLKRGGVTIAFRCIDGKYPNYKGVLPTAFDGCGATVDARQLARLDFVASHQDPACTFSPADGTASVKSSDASASVPAQVRGEKPFAFNLMFLTEQGRITQTMKIDGKSPSDPFRVIGDDPDAMWVIMPMKVQ